jgi:hypothetical protein
MNTPLEWLKAVPTTFAGTVYEPWAQLLHFLLMVAVFVSAIVWLLTRRHVIAVARQAWSLLVRANNALKRASYYEPATERHRARLAPYVALVTLGLMGIFETLCMVLAMLYFVIALMGGIWAWVVIMTLFWVWFMCRSRLDWAAASWAWHSITTGEEFTWPKTRTY